jgi:hypothetical protein
MIEKYTVSRYEHVSSTPLRRRHHRRWTPGHEQEIECGPMSILSLTT